MRSNRIQIFLSIFLAGAALLSMPVIAGEANSVDSPAMGYVVRPEVPELRAMLGIPGAARFSDPLPLPEGTTAAEVAPGHRWVLVIRAADAIAYLPASQSVVALPGAQGMPAAWTFSPTGSRLALSYPDRGVVVLLSGLPSTPKLEATLQIAAFDAFAAGDNGTLVYTSGNRIFTGDGQFLYESPSLGPLSFESGTDSIVVFDGSNSSLVEVGVTSTSSRVLATGLTFTPETLFAGRDRIYAGSATVGTVALIEYADGSITSQSVNVSRISPSGIAGTMLVAFDSDGPAWLVNSQGVSFVPAIVKQAVQ